MKGLRFQFHYKKCNSRDDRHLLNESILLVDYCTCRESPVIHGSMLRLLFPLGQVNDYGKFTCPTVTFTCPRLAFLQNYTERWLLQKCYLPIRADRPEDLPAPTHVPVPDLTHVTLPYISGHRTEFPRLLPVSISRKMSIDTYKFSGACESWLTSFLL